MVKVKFIDAKINIYPVPGPSAVTAAVSISGFSEQYIFYGFLPKKENELSKVLKNLHNLNYTIVFFIPSPKINFFISKFKKYFFNRKILIAREMTKIHEHIIREKVESIDFLSENLKG